MPLYDARSGRRESSIRINLAKGPMIAHVAQKFPYATPVEASKDYYWCACGLSKTQPPCDGAHKALV
jgi:CDGSH-type Zn-finger protein